MSGQLFRRDDARQHHLLMMSALQDCDQPGGRCVHADDRAVFCPAKEDAQRHDANVVGQSRKPQTKSVIWTECDNSGSMNKFQSRRSEYPNERYHMNPTNEGAHEQLNCQHPLDIPGCCLAGQPRI